MPFPDHKDATGAWVGSFVLDGKWHKTRARVIYTNVLGRCRSGSSHQRVRPTYAGCTNKFESFQDFAQWATSQPAYFIPGSQLDKDLLSKGNKVYSKETCVFVPPKLNMLLVKSDATRGDLPIGVCRDERGRIVAGLSVDGRRVNLGYFKDVDAAFAAYRLAKEARIRELALAYRDQVDPRVFDALMNYKVEMTD